MSDSTNVVGHSVSRIDAVAKVTGAARYPGDLEMPGMLHMKILFAERPHARIVRLDTARGGVPWSRRGEHRDGCAGQRVWLAAARCSCRMWLIIQYSPLDRPRVSRIPAPA